MTVEDPREALRARPISRRRQVRRGLRAAVRRVVQWVGPFVLKNLARTWRMTILGTENLEGTVVEHRGHFMSLWHGRILFGLAHHGSQEWYALVSASGDGAILGELLERFGYRLVRGSTGQSGARAVREILRILDSGAVVAITPDGPRGPRHAMNPGLAWLARATGYPVLPVGFACGRALRSKSWDRFTIPLPWTRVVMAYERPIAVGRDGGEAELAAANEAIRDGMLRAERRGFELLQKEPDW